MKNLKMIKSKKKILAWPVPDLFVYICYTEICLEWQKKSHFSSQIKVCTISSRYWTRKIGYRKLFSPALMISDFSSWISVLSSTQKLKKFSSKFQLNNTTHYYFLLHKLQFNNFLKKKNNDFLLSTLTQKL